MYFRKNTSQFFFTVGVLIIFKILTMQSCQSNTHLINIFWKIDCQFRMVQWWLHGRPAWIHTRRRQHQENVSFKLSISQLIDEKPSQKRLKLWHKRLFFFATSWGSLKAFNLAHNRSITWTFCFRYCFIELAMFPTQYNSIDTGNLYITNWVLSSPLCTFISRLPWYNYRIPIGYWIVFLFLYTCFCFPFRVKLLYYWA